MSYSADRVDGFQQAASYVDRILRGAKPADLPVQTPIKYEMVVQRVDPAMPCVMSLAADPIGADLVPSLARPGGRFTGLTTMDLEFDAKRIDLLHEAVPELTRARLPPSGG
jgi:ABC-type uncharacterized transport system substrate-binding protein